MRKNKLITFGEFRETVLEKTDAENSMMDLMGVKEDVGIGGGEEGKEGKEGKESGVDAGEVLHFGQKFTDMVSQMEISRNASARSALPSPGSIHASVQEKGKTKDDKKEKQLVENRRCDLYLLCFVFFILRSLLV